MALQIHRKLHNGSSLGIWLIEEPESFFYEQLGAVEFMPEKRLNKQLEKLAARHLLNTMNGKPVHSQLIYDAFGKPFLREDPRFISFSHKYPFVALVMSSHPFTGIDMERLSNTPHKLRSKFVGPEDCVDLITSDPLEQATLIWSAKECLYKVYGKKALDFKEHMRVWVNADQKLMGRVQKKSHTIELELHYFVFQNYAVVHTI